ncbi:hypothetical protein AF332_11240 [Sporosarcina globispora]|uniref:Phage protein n=1 Tax=Sporosarcina globispora TaxID=1459 RepID=A0A0M0GC46_SPOGL|nr:hypothetical protein [Sporosarcina globispora]KON87343.1 hypothetical protein AF332_11240 [Sporosarcina globispora]
MKDYSNYHGLNTNDKITHDGLLILEQSLDGFAGYEVIINDSIHSKVLIYEKWDSNSETKKVIGRIQDIERGNLLKVRELNWLITTLPEDNKIYRKAEIQLCNSTFPISSNKTSVLIGYNEFDEPIYEDTVTEVTSPCIVSTSMQSANTDEPINLPEGQIEVTIPYTESENILEGKEFKMYNATYKIIGIDYTKAINQTGLVIIKGKRV